MAEAVLTRARGGPGIPAFTKPLRTEFAGLTATRLDEHRHDRRVIPGSSAVTGRNGLLHSGATNAT